MDGEVIKPHTVNTVPRMDPVDIMGLSGRFPESSSASEFFCHLISGFDMVTSDERKWKHFMQQEVPRRSGKLKPGELTSFDAQFFGVHGQQAKKMDPQLYKLLEVSWEAWNDSGIDVRALRDSNRVGVYTGICGSEVHGFYIGDRHEITGYEQTGCVMSMTANRLSFFYSFRGPSKTCDTACSSAAHSLHDALTDITDGRIDYALVLGSCHILAPNMTLAFQRLHMLSPEGSCKAFDAAGNGYVRSEGIAAIVLKRGKLQKPPLWMSIPPYGTVLNCGVNNDGFTKEGITFPSRHAQLALEKQVCQEANINPKDICYVEAHGTGTVAGDGQELDAINKWYGQAPGRTEPVLIGSVKSNMGHCEGASCLASVIKLCLSLEYGIMPGNLHYHRDTPNPESEGLRKGTLQVCDETIPFSGGLIALSSFGFGGANMHLVMEGKGGSRIKMLRDSQDGSSEDEQIQGVIPLAARTADGLVYLAKIIKKAEEADGHSYAQPLRRYANAVAADFRLGHRGVLVNGSLRASSPITEAPQVYFVFSGNGSQWPKMAASLLEENAIFRDSIKACAAVVKGYDIDLLAEFEAERGWKTPLLAAVGLLAVQVGLVDVLRKQYGITAKGMLGHSAGEIACTYASGCCSREQAMLIAYHRGRLPIEQGVTNGLMAATGMPADVARRRLAGSNVVMACDNSPSSTTISGPAKDVKEILQQLEKEQIFNRALDTNGVPFHSPSLDCLLPELSRSLSEVMPTPIRRPEGWLTTAYPLDSGDHDARLCSAQYQVHSYRNPVRFTDAASAVPAGAILLEIGPHSILRSPLRQSRPDLPYVGAMKKGDSAVETLEAAVCELWGRGVPVQWDATPVPNKPQACEVPRSIREALVSWDRTLFDIPALIPNKPRPGVKYERLYDLGGEDAYICDHTIDGNVFIPLSCFLVTAWEAFAQFEEKTIWQQPVEFSDVSVYMPVQAERTAKVILGVLFDFSNRFQVLHGDDVVCDGTLKKYNTEERLHKEHVPLRHCQDIKKPSQDATGVAPETYDHLLGEHWYNLCERQNLQYGPKFQMVVKYAVDRTWCDIRWDKNWIIHLDGVFQTADRLGDHHVHVARGMRRLVIADTMTDEETGFIEHLDFDTFWKVTRGNSVILESYKDEIATSKHKAARILVHRNTWLPYGERTAANNKQSGYALQLLKLAKTVLADARHPALSKVKELFDSEAIPTLTKAEFSALTSDEANLLALVLSDSLSSGKSITAHADYAKALAEDAVLSVNAQIDLDALLAIAISNMKARGYHVGELGAGGGEFTRQALVTFLKVPQSALLTYTAMDTEETSDITKAIPHTSLQYKAWDINGEANCPSSDGEPLDIIIARHLSVKVQDLPAALSALYNGMREGGFLYLQELTGPLGAAVFSLASKDKTADSRAFGPCTSVDNWRQLLAKAGFLEVSTVRCPHGTSVALLWRKPSALSQERIVLQAPELQASTETMDKWLNSYRGALHQADPENGSTPGTVWLKGNFDQNPGMLGFLSSARKEMKGNSIRAICGWDASQSNAAERLDSVAKLDLIVNVFKDGRNGIYVPYEADEYKHMKDEEDCEDGAHLNFETYGNLKSAVWRENPAPPSKPGLVQCDVAYGALNFRDVMLAYGKLSKQQMAHESGGDNIGFEFSGIQQFGMGPCRVMGSATNAIATKVITRNDLLWEVPEQWTLAEAATVPTAYMTAYYALLMRGRLEEGQRVLIHSGTGAVGLAAIQICLFRNAEVFVTVGTAAKRKFLLAAFPKLQEDHIGDSRSSSFEGMVMNLTRGKGVHLALNSLADEKLQATVRCLGHWGKLLEIGKYDILQGTPLSMRPMLNNISFEGIDVDRVMNHPDSTELESLMLLVGTGIGKGEVRPLPVTVFPRTDIEEAFRFLAGGSHIGKVLIDTSATPQMPSAPHSLGGRAAQSFLHDSAVEASYTQVPRSLKLQPSTHFRDDRCYVITGGLGGFGMALAEWLGDHGARHLVITSKRGVRNGSQQAALQQLHSHGVNFRVSTLDVGVPKEAEALIKLASELAPVGGIFHLAMYLADKLLQNQTGQSWNAVMHAKAHGAYNLDKASRQCTRLDHFVMWSSIVASAGNEGQTNYGYANASLDILAERRRADGLPALAVEWGVIDHVGVADKNIQALMEAGLLGASMAQPIDNCLTTLGRLMVSGPLGSPVMSSSWQPLDILGKGSSGNEKKDLLGSILTVMGLTAGNVSNTDTLARLGIDSMQMVEVRSNLQRALNRPMALEDVQNMTIAGIKAIEGIDEDAPAEVAADAAANAAQPGAPQDSSAAPVIQPSKIINLARDLPSSVPAKASEVYRSELNDEEDQAEEAEVFDAAQARQERIQRSRQAASRPRPDIVANGMQHSTDEDVGEDSDEVDGAEYDGLERNDSASSLINGLLGGKKQRVSFGRSAEDQVAQLRSGHNPTQGRDSYDWTWDGASRLFGLGTAVVLGWLAASGFRRASGYIDHYGVLVAIPLLPLVYFLMGSALVFLATGAKYAALTVPGHNTACAMFTNTFTRWWLVCRIVDITNTVFMRHFRGTVLVNWYLNMLGAQVDNSAYVDSLDILDPDLVKIGKDAVIGEGTTIVPHTIQNGEIRFSEVVIGEGTQTQPYALLTPQITLQQGSVLTTHGSQNVNSGDVTRRLQSRAPDQINSQEMRLLHATLGQMAGLAVVMMVTSAAACMGVHTFGRLMAILGTGLRVTPTAFGVASLVAMSNPIIAIFSVLLIPAQGFTWATLIELIPTFLAALLAAPLALIAAAATHMAMTWILKSAIIGSSRPGTHWRLSRYGVLHWTSQRLTESLVTNYGTIVGGTWALNFMYRLLGAKIGRLSIIRSKAPGIATPEMLTMGDNVVTGDTTRIVTDTAVNSKQICTAPVRIDTHALVGAWAVALPGSIIGQQATLAPLAASGAGTEVAARSINLGSPARSVKVEDRGLPKVDVAKPFGSTAIALQPLAHVVIITTLVILSHTPAAIAACWVLANNRGPAAGVLASVLAVGVQCQLIGRLNAYMQTKVNAAKPAGIIKQWSMHYIMGCTLATVTIFCNSFGEQLWKGSPAWVDFARRTGIKVGKRVYIDAEWAGEPGTTYGDWSSADRGSIVYGHMLAFTGRDNVLQFNTVEIGRNAHLAPRCALLPGVTVRERSTVRPGELQMAL